MATAEQTVNGVAGPSVGAEPEAGSNAAHEPARQNAAAVQAADTPMDAPAAGEGAAGKGRVTTRCYLVLSGMQIFLWCFRPVQSGVARVMQS